MARRGRRSDEGSSADISNNASPDPLDGLLDPLPALPIDPVSSIEEFIGPSIPNDRRVFSFGEPERYTFDVAGTGGVARSSALPTGVRFVVPDTVAICVRRKERREVLHAFRKTRKRGGGSRRTRWYSKIKC